MQSDFVTTNDLVVEPKHDLVQSIHFSCLHLQHCRLHQNIELLTTHTHNQKTTLLARGCVS